MTMIDRFLVFVARLALRTLHLRFNQAKGRVWWWTVETTRPRPGLWPDAQVAGYGLIGFGGSREEAFGNRNRNAVLAITFTKEMVDLAADSAVKVRDMQDAQLAVLRQEGHNV